MVNQERDAHMVDDLLVLKEDVEAVLTESFGRSDKFKNATKDAFETFINKRQNKPAECIGVCCVPVLNMLEKRLKTFVSLQYTMFVEIAGTHLSWFFTDRFSPYLITAKYVDGKLRTGNKVTLKFSIA